VKIESDQTTAQHTDADNVVPLPRDWLGPRDQLVPVGKVAAADRAGSAPPTAEDFWSEDSAALQDAWQAPEPRESAGPAAQPQLEGDAGVTASVSRLRAPAMRARLVAVAAVIAALAATALAVWHPGSGSPPARSDGHPSSKLAADTKVSTGHARSTHVVTRPQPRVSHPRIVAKRSKAKRATHRVKDKPLTSSSDANTSNASAAGSTSSIEAQQTTPVVANPTPQHEDSMVSGGDSSTGHPTGAGAAIAPGYIP
jgi:hypothetical protein